MELLGIEEDRVRIEAPQHARDSPAVDGVVGVDRVGRFLLDHGIDLGELLEQAGDLFIVK